MASTPVTVFCIIRDHLEEEGLSYSAASIRAGKILSEIKDWYKFESIPFVDPADRATTTTEAKP